MITRVQRISTVDQPCLVWLTHIVPYFVNESETLGYRADVIM